jgi:hypothetical protein
VQSVRLGWCVESVGGRAQYDSVSDVVVLMEMQLGSGIVRVRVVGYCRALGKACQHSSIHCSSLLDI